MTTTIQATALPHSLADDATFQLTVFITHKLVGDQPTLAGYPAAAGWVDTLGGCSLGLVTSNDPDAVLPLRVVSAPDSAAWGHLTAGLMFAKEIGETNPHTPFASASHLTDSLGHRVAARPSEEALASAPRRPSLRERASAQCSGRAWPGRSHRQ